MPLPYHETPTATLPSGDLAVDAVAQELEFIESERLRRYYKREPVAWARDRAKSIVWSKQVEILESVRDHRKTAVKSCHQVGKSFSAGLVVGWWLDVHPPGEAFVVTSAPSGPQVKAILWKEISRVHTRGNLLGRLNQTEWFMPVAGGKEELVAFGRKPADYDATAFQGIHARYVLYVFDEACGMIPSLWEAADSLAANEYSKGFAIGNPDDPNTEFHEICRPGSGWKIVTISAFDSPNFTGEALPERVKEELIGPSYVEEKRRKWAPRWRWNEEHTRVEPPPGANPVDTNPLWQSKVLGEFPLVGDELGLLPMHWIRRAQTANLPAVGSNRIGVDVGGGGDASAGCHRHGPVARIRWSDRNPDTMQTCGNAVHHMLQTGAEQVNVDTIGIGRGVVDRGKEQGHKFIGVNVGEKPRNDKAFVNARAEYWWDVRTLFETGDIDIDENDEDLAAELASIRYKRTSNGKIQIESKDDARRRGVPSPNRAEALMLAFAEGKKKLTRATWGR